jgi:hypothetical protein
MSPSRAKGQGRIKREVISLLFSFQGFVSVSDYSLRTIRYRAIALPEDLMFGLRGQVNETVGFTLMTRGMKRKSAEGGCAEISACNEISAQPPSTRRSRLEL